jgi:hypothetical protein
VVRLDDQGPNRVVPKVFEDGPMNLARTRRGLMVHDRNCQYARNGLPWLWADDRAAFEVRLVVETLGYFTCKFCNPLGVHR